MIPKRVLLVQTILEGAIPALGYFYWDWDTSFVLIWFLLDWLISFIITSLKGKKRYTYSRQEMEQKLLQKRVAIGISSILLTSLFVWFTLPNITENFHWTERIWAFLSYAELGIPQGIILVPLMVLNAYLLFTKQFVQLKLYERMGMEAITKTIPLEALLITPIAFLACLSSFIVQYPPELLLFSSILGITAVRLIQRS
jgi:hypothetical protein